MKGIEQKHYITLRGKDSQKLNNFDSKNFNLFAYIKNINFQKVVLFGTLHAKNITTKLKTFPTPYLWESK